MKIICVVKFVPDVDSFEYDNEKHVLIREKSKMMINPDDACALGFALKIKKREPGIFVELLTMGPASVTPLVEDILRVGVDRGTIISDRIFAGSDTLATSRILARYLSSIKYDCILTGTQAVDGDTSQVPPQIGEALGLSQISSIAGIDEESFNSSTAVVKVEDEQYEITYQVDMPAVLSFSHDSGYRLPYVRYKDQKRDVTGKLNQLSNVELGFTREEVGLKGSLTQVARVYTKKYEKRARLEVTTDPDGIETVYNFLKEKQII